MAYGVILKHLEVDKITFGALFTGVENTDTNKFTNVKPVNTIMVRYHVFSAWLISVFCSFLGGIRSTTFAGQPYSGSIW
jgi:uncharacterized protein YegJ (DUF2314 family)